MKKTITSLTVLVLTAAMLLPMGAAADNTGTIIPSDGTPFDVTPNPGSQYTTVEFSVDPAYTVTIPVGVVLQANDPEKLMDKYSNYTTLKAENVFLREGEKIVVKLSAGSEFNMKAKGGKDYMLPYTAYKVNVADGQVDDDSKQAVKKTAEPEDADVIAEFSGATTDFPKSVYVLYETDEALQYSGTYTDTVTYTISIEGSPVIDQLIAKQIVVSGYTLTYYEGKPWGAACTVITEEEDYRAFQTAADNHDTSVYSEGLYYFKGSPSLIYYHTSTELYILLYQDGDYDKPVKAADDVDTSLSYLLY